MPLPPWRKALGRAKALSASQLLQIGARRTRAGLRARRQELDAIRLGLQGSCDRLVTAVPGAADLAEAVNLIERSAGAPPVSPAKLSDLLPSLDNRFPGFAQGLTSRADRACEGIWDVLGHPPAQLGRRPDWQQDFVSGQRWDPSLRSRQQPIVRGGGSDIKIPWELSRLQHLPAVAHAFRLNRDQRYLELICEQLDDWIERNPPGLGVNWVGPMEVALRAVSIAWAWELCRDDSRVPLALRAKVYWSLFAHGHFLRGHLEDGGPFVGNHYVANLLGLIWIGHAYPALTGARGWHEDGHGLLVRHLRGQVLADGGDCEASTAYHRLVAEMVGLAAAVSHAPELVEVFVRMARFTAAILKPDGTAPQLGDNDGGRAFRLLDRAALDHRYLPAWGGLLDPPNRHPLDPEAVLLTGSLPDTTTASETVPVTELRSSQLTVLRDRQSYVLLSATPVGQAGAGGHGHNDKLSFELFLDSDVVVDPGSYCYTSDSAARNAFRRTAAHATLQVESLEQNPITEDLFHLPERAHARVLRSNREGDGWIWVAEHLGFDPFVHRRTVRVDLAAKRLGIVDEVFSTRGPSDQLRITSRVPLAAGLVAEADGDDFLVRRGTRIALRIKSPGAGLSLEEGWYSPNYGSRERCQVLSAIVSGKPPLRLELHLVVP